MHMWWATIVGTANAHASKSLFSTMLCYAATHPRRMSPFAFPASRYTTSPNAAQSFCTPGTFSPSFHVPPHPIVQRGIADARSRSNVPNVGGPQVLTCLVVLSSQGLEVRAEGREGERGEGVWKG
jgi:hypothetical protein